MKNLLIKSSCFLALMAFSVVSYSAVFIKIDGVKGESSNATHSDVIDVLSWNWGALRQIELKPNKSANIGKKITHMEISFSKLLDSTTPTLFGMCSSGQPAKDAILIVRKSDQDPIDYIIEMKRLMVTSVSTGRSGGEDRLTENITLSFEEIEVQFIPTLPDGSSAPPVEYSWSINQGKKG